MSLYNKYRPAQFSQILGQDQIINILKNQAKTGQYHHAYLFFGSSGSGKTTTARILAMTINCLNLDGTGEPCGECYSCQAIKNHSHWDVIEVDGARFRGIDDIKDLTFRAYLSPFNANKKIYIIDEVHALTNDAFNCLLRLIEEPPPHIVIMLITTDFVKIPETVSSRCELLPFKKLKPEDMVKKLTSICQTEGRELDHNYLEFVAQSCNGNMRSAENMLEECLVLRR